MKTVWQVVIAEGREGALFTDHHNAIHHLAGLLCEDGASPTATFGRIDEFPKLARAFAGSFPQRVLYAASGLWPDLAVLRHEADAPSRGTTVVDRWDFGAAIDPSFIVMRALFYTAEADRLRDDMPALVEEQAAELVAKGRREGETDADFVRRLTGWQRLFHGPEVLPFPQPRTAGRLLQALPAKTRETFEALAAKAGFEPAQSVTPRR